LSPPPVIFAQNQYKMPEKIKPTASQKRNFMIHCIVYAIGVVVMVMVHRKQGEHQWAYPWHAWIIAAWGLSLIGHWCAVYTSFSDKGMDEYHRQEKNG
jgi:hypothetical protein